MILKLVTIALSVFLFFAVMSILVTMLSGVQLEQLMDLFAVHWIDYNYPSMYV